MPFTLLKGTFQPKFGHPDGDSLRFVPDNLDPIFKLRRRGFPPKINPNNGSIQLRFEGIDTPEKAAIEPFASDATNSNLDLAGTDGGENPARGYIFSNQLGPHGRPIAFIFAGESDGEDGSQVFLNGDNLTQSVNYQQMQLGHAYPLYYDTLFRDLRDSFNIAVSEARASGLGIWSQDATNEGFQWHADLAQYPPIFPKLWRRIQAYMNSETFFDANNPANGLVDFLASKDERVMILSKSKFTGFDNVIAVEDGNIRMIVDPTDLVVVSVK